MDLTFRSVDADNHYYEALDSCTRYLDPAFKQRGVQIVQQGSHQLLLAAAGCSASSPTRRSTPSSSPDAWT